MSVTRLGIQIDLLSPAHFGAGANEGNVALTLPYLPGATLRGALATLFVQSHPSDDHRGLFEWAFLSGKVRWPDLHTRGGRVTPLSQRACKLEPDLHPLIDEATFAPRKAPTKCSTCQAPLERAKAAAPKQRRLTRTAISPATLSAVQGSLHALDVISEGEALSGLLTADDTDSHWPALQQWLTTEASAEPLAVGGDRSRGLGAARLTVSSAAPSRLTVEQRLTAWNRGNAADKGHFSVTLLSPVIARDLLWRFQRSLDEAALREVSPELGEAPLERKGAWTSSRLIGGWDDRLALAKEQCVALERGCVFVFESGLPVAALAVALERLEERGIGERLSEGFGEVSICNPIHLDPIAVNQENP